jgi:hypothetical protein
MNSFDSGKNTFSCPVAPPTRMCCSLLGPIVGLSFRGCMSAMVELPS